MSAAAASPVLSRAPAPGVCVTLWSGDGIARALTPATCALLAASRPDAVQLHSSPHDLRTQGPAVARRVVALLPTARLWLGLGCDGLVSQIHHGIVTADDAARQVVDAVAAVHAAHPVEAVVPDAEGTTEAFPEAGKAFAAALLAAMRARFPEVLVGHTAYDDPTYHARYPWAAWLGEGGCDFSLPQVYSGNVPAGQLTHGALPQRAARSAASYATAAAHGWVRAGLPVYPYVQAHGVATADTVALGAAVPVVVVWTFPGECDDAGALALRALCELRRRVSPGADAVLRFQRLHNATAELRIDEDNRCGPQTLLALGVAA